MAEARRTGAIGALLDIYEAVIADLKNTLRTISDTSLLTIIDANTQDENCRSMQTILTHVVHAGYGYATSIYNHQGHDAVRPQKVLLETTAQYAIALNEMLAYTEKIFEPLTDEDLEQPEEARKMLTGWGQRYDVEQLMEHAIVHMLRHRRQMEKLKRMLPDYEAE